MLKFKKSEQKVYLGNAQLLRANTVSWEDASMQTHSLPKVLLENAKALKIISPISMQIQIHLKKFEYHEKGFFFFFFF